MSRRKSVVAEPPTGVGSATRKRYCGQCGTEENLKPMGDDGHRLLAWCWSCWRAARQT